MKRFLAGRRKGMEAIDSMFSSNWIQKRPIESHAIDSVVRHIVLVKFALPIYDVVTEDLWMRENGAWRVLFGESARLCGKAGRETC